jgi:hypothetical protein
MAFFYKFERTVKKHIKTVLSPGNFHLGKGKDKYMEVKSPVMKLLFIILPCTKYPGE